MLKESDDLVILGVTFDSKMTFEKHLHSVSRAASQRLGILRKARGRIIKTLVKLQCSAPCVSSYNMKATMCQQCCKSGSSKIYTVSSLSGGCICYYEGHIVASTCLLTTWNSQSENVLQTIVNRCL